MKWRDFGLAEVVDAESKSYKALVKHVTAYSIFLQPQHLSIRLCIYRQHHKLLLELNNILDLVCHDETGDWKQQI